MRTLGNPVKIYASHDVFIVRVMGRWYKAREESFSVPYFPIGSTRAGAANVHLRPSVGNYFFREGLTTNGTR